MTELLSAEVYAAPESGDVLPARPRSIHRPPSRGASYRPALELLAASTALLVVSLGATLLTHIEMFFLFCGPLAVLLALAGAASALWSLYTSMAHVDAMRARPIVLSLVALLGNLVMSMVGALATLLARGSFSRGRQLRQLGKVLQAPVVTSERWLRSAPSECAGLNVPAAQRASLAARWRDNGRTEHASVAAFARLSLDLLALDAPASLIVDAHADALDEVRHTQLCFELARDLDGVHASPGSFPEAARARTLPRDRTLALATLAVDSLVDGALNEGVSARIVSRLARSCTSPAIQRVLKQIARDEGRHAAHGWEVVVFCLTEGGEPVAQALRAALKQLPERLEPSADPEASSGAWEQLGIAGRALEDDEFQKARADVIRRVERLTSDASPRAKVA